MGQAAKPSPESTKSSTVGAPPSSKARTVTVTASEAWGRAISRAPSRQMGAPSAA